MRVAFFAHSLTSGGIGKVMLHLAEGFAAKGIEVDIVLVRKTGAYLPLFESKPFNLIDLNSRHWPLPVLKFSRYLLAAGPDAVISMGGFRNSTALLARLLTRSTTKLILTEHSFYSFSEITPTHSFLKKCASWLLFRFASRLSYRLAGTIVAVSHFQARYLERLLWLKKGRIQVIPNPVVDEALLEKAQAPLDHPWLKKRVPVILSAGRLHPQKDFPQLLKAFQLLRLQRECKLIILGEGPERPKLEALIATLGIGADVELAGFCENPYPYMRQADLFALASAHEPFGLVLVEAMACGCPIVATHAPGGVAEILAQGQFGTLVARGDAIALAQAMNDALSGKQPASREQLRQRAQDFTVAKATDRYLQLIGQTA